MPRSQSSGWAHAVKVVRSVVEVERCGSSGAVMGGKRVSSKALDKGGGGLVGLGWVGLGGVGCGHKESLRREGVAFEAAF